MVFSSIPFLFYFLPVLLMIYYFVNDKYKNLILLLFSMIFYIYGEPKYILILLLSIIVNYIFGLLIEKNNKKYLLVMNMVFNIGLLLYFKYMDFFISNINNVLNISIPLLKLVMPIGISFFTFQTISYIVDVYRKDVKASHNILNFATYVSLFPQLVAGPIVRYKDIDDEINNRHHGYDMFASGVSRFTIGLSKKVLIANTLGEVAKKLLYLSSKSVLSYWLEVIIFTLQLYFDFSGYSDMAIGLGKMLGFNFKENFNYPLVANSITDFWRRWHMSLSSFFRDYIYIPLGGNRTTKIKWIRNIFIVWLLTGFWHGAAWNFILWGLFFAIILLLEKLLLSNFLDRHKVFAHIYSIIIILISFIIFNVSNMKELFIYLKSIIGLNNLPLFNIESLYYLKSSIVLLIIATIGSTPLLKNISNKIKNKKIFIILEPLWYILLLLLATSFLVDSSFNPFLYFRF